MRKLFAILTTLCLLLATQGCGSREPDYVEPPESANDPDAGVVIDEEVMGAPSDDK